MMYGKCVLAAAVLFLAAGVAAAAGPGAEHAHGPGCVVRPFGEPAPADGVRGRAPATPPGPPALAPLATVGALHCLTILAEFSDRPARIDPARFRQQLYEGVPSLADYYQDVSRGMLTLTGDVFGWVTLPQSQGFYSGGAAGVGTYPNNGQRMTEDAVRAAVAAGLDLNDYDADGDGIVDVLHVIHSGQGFEWAGETGRGAPSSSPDPESINSHKWTVQDGDFGASTQVLDYFTTPELLLTRPLSAPAWTDSIATIGVVCHEFGHVLGLPDFYDTGTLENNVSVWGIMDFGTWNRISSDPAFSAPGSLPGHPSLWSKMFLGWTTPVVLAPGVGEFASEVVSLTSPAEGGSGLQILTNPDGVDWSSQQTGSGEYFLFEVRTQTGYDAGLPGEGLLIYHVDESRTNNNASANADGGAQLRLVAEDGEPRLTQQPGGNPAGDPWPGTQTSFFASSTPTSRLWDGTESGVSVSSIAGPAAGSVSFLAEVRNLVTSIPLPFARPNPFRPSVHGETGLVLNLAPGGRTDRVTVHDVRGRRVRTLTSGADFSAADNVVFWDGNTDRGTRAVAGMYLFRQESDGNVPKTGRIVLLR